MTNTVTPPLGDLVDIVMGQAPRGEECNKEGVGTVFVKAGEFAERRPIVREWTTKPLKLAREGDVLVCVVGATAGKINEAINCAIGRSVAAVRPKDSKKLAPSYLYHFLNTTVERLRIFSQGVAQGVITREMIEELRIPLPPLSEQRRIADILDKADALRAKRRAALAQLATLAQSIFLDMFGDPTSNPRGWPRIPLERLCSIDSPLVDPTRDQYRNLLHYGPDRIERDTGVLLEAKTAEEDNLISAKFLFSESAILYSKIRPNLNKVALARGRGLCSADVYPVEVIDRLITREFLWCLLRDPDFLRYAAELSNRANIPKINRGQFLSYKAICPPIDIQRKFSIDLEAVLMFKDAHKISLRSLDALFASLQHRAFRGELTSAEASKAA